MKILIAVPTYENIYPDVFKAIYDLDKGGHECLFEFIRGYDCAAARNRIAQRALDLNTDYVLMVDNDTVIPEDALLKLLEDARDVNLGYYAHRNSANEYIGNTNICRIYDPDGQMYFDYPLESQYKAEELAEMTEIKIQLHGGGLGCALIRTEVFRKLPYPWFRWVCYQGKERRILSEDMFFSELCRKKGVGIYADTRVACGHIFRRTYWPE